MKLNTDRPLIYLITKGESTDADFERSSRDVLAAVALAVETRIHLVQVREKHVSARHLFELTQRAVEIARGSETKILVNDRVDVALAAGADGVHLTARSMPVRVVRAMTPSGFLVAASTHNIDEVSNAASSGADLAVFGPVFETPNKGEPLGIERLSEACAVDPNFLVLALGGVDESNYAAAASAGAAGFAAIRTFNDPDSLKRFTRLIENYPSE